MLSWQHGHIIVNIAPHMQVPPQDRRDMVAHMESNPRDAHHPIVVEAPDFGLRRFTRRGALALGKGGAGLVPLGPAALARAAAPSHTVGSLHGTLAVDIYSYRPQPSVKEPQIMWRR